MEKDNGVLVIESQPFFITRKLYRDIFRAGFNVGIVAASDKQPSDEHVENLFERFGILYLDRMEHPDPISPNGRWEQAK